MQQERADIAQYFEIDIHTQYHTNSQHGVYYRPNVLELNQLQNRLSLNKPPLLASSMYIALSKLLLTIFHTPIQTHCKYLNTWYMYLPQPSDASAEGVSFYV